MNKNRPIFLLIDPPKIRILQRVFVFMLKTAAEAAVKQAFV
jgi:hypothetical protein